MITAETRVTLGVSEANRLHRYAQAQAEMAACAGRNACLLYTSGQRRATVKHQHLGGHVDGPGMQAQDEVVQRDRQGLSPVAAKLGVGSVPPGTLSLIHI